MAKHHKNFIKLVNLLEGGVATMKKVIIGFIVLVMLTPFGLLAPGSAWGEWGLSEIKEKFGLIPQGMAHFNGIIKILHC